MNRVSKLLRPIVAAAALAVAAPALAQSPEQTSLARDMMVAMRAADNFDAVLPAVMNALKPVITKGDAKMAKDWEEISPIMAQEFSALKGSLLDDIAAIYAKAFEPAELRAFVAFYKSPAGEKLARLTPTLAQQTLAAGQSFGQKVATQIAGRMQEELRKRGNKI